MTKSRRAALTRLWAAIPGRPSWVILILGVLLLTLAAFPLSSAHAAIGSYSFLQCANDSDDDGSVDDCEWTSGNLSSNGSVYGEGSVVPHRVFIEVATAGSHFVVIDHSLYQQSQDAYTYDFFASPDYTQNSDALLNACADLPTFLDLTECQALLAGRETPPLPDEGTWSTTSGGPFTYGDPTAFITAAQNDFINNDAGTRNFWIGCIDGTTGTAYDCYNELVASNAQIRGHVDAAGNLVADQDGPPTLDRYVELQISFTTNSDEDIVVILIGAHVAKTAFWVDINDSTECAAQSADPGCYAGSGAGGAAGASFHVRITEDDDGAIGSRDNQMQVSAVTEPTAVTLASFGAASIPSRWTAIGISAVGLLSMGALGILALSRRRKSRS